MIERSSKLFLSVLIFSLWLGTVIRNSDKNGTRPQRKLASNMASAFESAKNPFNCFSNIADVVMSATPKRLKPWTRLKNNIVAAAKRTFRGKNQLDNVKVNEYFDRYYQFLPKDLEEFNQIPIRRIDIDESPESLLAYIYATSLRYSNWEPLRTDDLLEGSIWAQRKVGLLLDKVIANKAMSPQEFEETMGEITWRLMGKESREILNTAIRESGFERKRLARSIYQMSLHNLVMNGFSKTHLAQVMDIRPGWYNAFMDHPITQHVFTMYSFGSIFTGTPTLPILPITGKSFMTDGMREQFRKGLTKEFFEEVHSQLVDTNGDYYAYKFLLNRENYRNWRRRYQQYVAPVLPFVAFYVLMKQTEAEAEKIEVEYNTIDYVLHRSLETQSRLVSLKQYGIDVFESQTTSIDPQELEGQGASLVSNEKVRDSYENDACRGLRSCLAQFGIVEIDFNSEEFKMCKKFRDKNNHCSDEEIANMFRVRIH